MANIYTGFQWTKEREADLIKWWNDGESAELIGNKFGISRSAVIGKVSRLRKCADLVLRDAPPTLHIGHGPRPVEKSRARIIKPSMSKTASCAKARAARPTITVHGVTMAVTAAWNEAQTYQVIEWWNNGLTTPVIASKSGRSIKSIEAKIYKLIQLGLCKPASDKPAYINSDKRYVVVGYKRSTDERKGELEKHGKRAIARMEAAAPGIGKTMLELGRSECRWPTGGSAPQWLFCSAPIDDGVISPYCAACRPRAFAGLSPQYGAAA